MITLFNASVVLLGGMNPAIHAPQWYRFAEIIGESDLEAALDPAAGLVVTSDLARFQTPSLSVTCTSDRWQVQSRQLPDVGLASLVEITKAVFDDRLEYTPIHALGLNLDYELGESGSDFAMAVTRALRPFFVDLPEGARSGFNSSWPAHGYERRIRLQPEKDGRLRLGTNAHIRFDVEGSFTLAEYVDSRLDEIIASSQALAEVILEQSQGITQKGG